MIVKRNICVRWTIILDGLSQRTFLRWNPFYNQEKAVNENNLVKNTYAKIQINFWLLTKQSDFLVKAVFFEKIR